MRTVGAQTAAMTALVIFTVSLAATPTETALAAGAGEAIIAKVVAAYGGKAALERVHAYRMEGTVTSSLRGTGAVVRTFARPDRLKVSLDYPGHPELRILDGARGWRSDGQGNMDPSEGFLLASMVLQAARANLPWLLLEHADAAKPLPPMDGGKIAGLEFPLGAGLTLTVYVENASGRIVRSSGILDAGGMKTNFATEYSEFRIVDGVLFPFREANYASGQTTGETTITRIAVNPPVAEKEFRP